MTHYDWDALASMAYAALPRINFFDSRRKGSIPYVPRQRLAPGVPPASRGLASQDSTPVSLVRPGSLLRRSGTLDSYLRAIRVKRTHTR